MPTGRMRIDPTDRRDPPSDDPALPLARESRREAERTLEPGRHVDASSAEAARLYAQNAVSTRGRVDASGGPAFNDRILYVGMNGKDGQCDREAASLRYGGNVVIEHGERSVGADHARVGARVVDLATDEGAAALAKSLGLPDAQTAAIAKAIRNAHDGSRDELAGIARVWARAEQGHDIPSRVVISGHCFGNAVWDGDGQLGELEFSSIRALAAAMPRAAARIEDVMISACSSGFDGASATGARFPLSAWKDMFPSLKTAWGYGNEHTSPTGAQAIGHIAAWANATRGRVQSLDGKKSVEAFFAAIKRAAPDPSKIQAPQLAGNVSVWTAEQGYVPGKD